MTWRIPAVMQEAVPSKEAQPRSKSLGRHQTIGLFIQVVAQLTPAGLQDQAGLGKQVSFQTSPHSPSCR